ncbi:hypothetical protein [Streptomyces sp900129855]|uniref:Uncharacterized protein n=1 Tax=Streptomyces sp. 900129855 TaxID=3155129 RepID=A0ABV2ZSJ7_9ACTN
MPQGTNARPDHSPGCADEPTSKTDRVAALHTQCREDYATGQTAREGMDRADALRREMWGAPTASGTQAAG